MVFSLSCDYRASMASPLLPLLAFLCVALTRSHAVLPSQVYWNSILPNTPMPKAIRDVLRPGGEKGQPVYVGVGALTAGSSPFLYHYSASEEQLHAHPPVALFFLQKDIIPGTKMNLHIIKTTNEATFSPQSDHRTLLLSSKNLPYILNHFSVKPESLEARIISHTIERCEAPAINGEEKYCATSLESMIDFSISKMGKQIEAISTEMEKEEAQNMQEYTVGVGVKKMAGDESVVCHRENYPYAVFYCHLTQATRTYMVPLMGADGSTAKAVAVCHSNTSEWNPKHLAFQVLKVKPGTVPVCHLLPQDHIIWVPKQISAE